MLKKRAILFYVLLIAALGCTHTSNNVEAEEPPAKKYMLPGDNTVECIFLENNLSIKVQRKANMCADKIWLHKDRYCTDVGVPYEDEKEGDKNTEKKEEGGRIPIPKIVSGNGNQYCPEAFVVYQNSPYCFQYTSGGRTRYIPRG